MLKASGKLFESGIRCIIRLSVGSVSQQTTARRHPLLDKRKPIAWEDESFVFPITQQIDALFVSCHKGDDERQEMIGTAVIQLQHLPQGTDVVKWYELKLKDESSAVVQLGLNYTLTYATHHGHGHESRTASLTMHPSSEAREFIRQQLLQYAHNSRTQYRFIDYFAIVGSANPRLLFSQPANSSSHSASILYRFPDDDHPDVQLPDEIAMFAFADSFSLSAEQHKEQLFSFRLNVDMDQLMVTCLKYWEPMKFERTDGGGGREGGGEDFLLPDNQPVQRVRSLSTVEHESVLMYVPRVLCFTSRLSYVAQHKEILTQLYHYFFSPPTSSLYPASMPIYPLPCPYHPNTQSGPPLTPSYPCILGCQCSPPIRLDCCGHTLESNLLLLLAEVPLPEPGSTPVDLTVGCRQYRLFLPASELDLPHVEFDVSELFQVLDVESVLMVMRCILSEMRIILYSSSMSLLHSVSECLIALCFPFTWSHVYVPLLPKQLHTIIEAPVSFIIGLHSSSPPNLEHITDLTPFALVDIDRSTVDLAQPPPAFPAHAVRVLLAGLRRLVRPDVFKADEVRVGGKRGESDVYARHHPKCGGGRCSRVDAVAVTEALSLPTPPPPQPSRTSSGKKLARVVSSGIPPIDPALQAQEDEELAACLSARQRSRLIRHECFAFLSSLLHGYRTCLFFSHGLTPTFNTSAFLANCPSSDQHVPWLSRFLETQLFRDFLDRHVEFPSYLQDYLTYIDSHVNNDKQQKAFVVERRKLRTIKEWQQLIHPYLKDDDPRLRSQTDDPPAHWSSQSLNDSEVVADGEGSQTLPSPADMSYSRGATSVSFGVSHQNMSPVTFHRDRVQSSPNTHSNSFGSSTILPIARRSGRVATVVSLAPAVTTFRSTQTIVTAAASTVAQSGRSITAEEEEKAQQSDGAESEFDAATFYMPWLMPQPRVFVVDKRSKDGGEVFTSAKNPSTLLHAPLPTMAVNEKGEIEIVGGMKVPGVDNSGAQKPKGEHRKEPSDNRQSIIINSTQEGDNLSIAIQSPKPTKSSIAAQPTKSDSLSPSPLAVTNEELSSPGSTDSPRRRRHSRGDGSFSLPHMSNRPQPVGLISKSEMELRKAPKDRRLPQLLDLIFSRHMTREATVDVGELSAVGELLALKEWRAMMVDLIGRLYGGYEESSRREGRDRDRMMDTEAFSSLLLLFNVALEECTAEADYVNAYTLLLFAEKYFTTRTSSNSTPSPNSYQTSSSSVSPHHSDRVYLLHSLKSQRLWHVLPLWTFAYAADVHRRRHRVFPSQPCSLCSADESLHTSASSDEQPLAEMSLDVVCHIIGVQIALGCRQEQVDAFIDILCEVEDDLAAQQQMLHTLVQSTLLANQSMQDTAHMNRSSPALPPPGVVRRGSSGGVEGAAGDFSGMGAG